MSKDTNKTKVIFRKWNTNGDILALFPEETWNNQGLIASYEHLGQHSGASYLYCMAHTKKANPNEYKDLKRELESIGYNLDVKQRHNRKLKTNR